MPLVTRRGTGVLRVRGERDRASVYLAWPAAERARFELHRIFDAARQRVRAREQAHLT